MQMSLIYIEALETEKSVWTKMMENTKERKGTLCFISDSLERKKSILWYNYSDAKVFDHSFSLQVDYLQVQTLFLI